MARSLSGPVADRVVVVVFDGLRPDLVSDDLTPNLAKFARGGVHYAQARTVFPSLTRVCAASLATGAPPATHGVIGNSFYHAAALPGRPIDLASIEEASLLDAAGGAVTAPCFADVLAAAGKRFAMATGCTAGATYLLAPHAAANGQWVYSCHGPGASVTPEAVRAMEARFGAVQDRDPPQFEVVDRVTDVFVEHILRERDPDVALAWYPEPDTSAHFIGLAADETLAVLGHCDAQFGRILQAVEAKATGDRTLIIVASDHGQITVSDDIPLFDWLTDAGFPTGSDLRSGQALMGVRGTVGELRVLEGGDAVLERAVAWLMEQPSIGQLFTRGGNGVEGRVPGTFSHGLVGTDHGRAPDITFVLNSSTEADRFGFPGRGLRMGEVPCGGTMHGGLNRYELTMFLAMSGAGVPARGATDRPAGLVDIAPSLLAALGLAIPESMTGRSLVGTQRLGSGDPQTETFGVGQGAFAQTVAVSRVGESRYLLEGQRSAR